MRCLIVGLVMSLLLPGCAVAGGRNGASVRAADRPESPADDTATLEVALVPTTLSSPADVVLTDQGAVIIADLLYDGLTEIDTATGTLRPGLASTWEANADFRRWTFQIDPDAGLTADEIVAGLARLVGEGSGPALTAGIEAISAPDDQTVLVDLYRSNAGFAWIVSGLPYSVAGPDGGPTGSYRIAHRTAHELHLTSRHDRSDGGRYEDVVVSWIDNGERGRELLEAGQVDAAVVDLATADGYRDQHPTMAGVRYYVLNLDSPNLATVDRRRGILQELDLATAVGGPDTGAMVPLNSLVPSTWLGHRPLDPPEPWTGRAASESVQPLRVAYAGSDQGPLAAALSRQLNEAGFEVQQDELSARDLASAIVDGSTDLFSFGWVAPAGSVDAVLPALLAAESPANAARIDSSVVEDLLARAAVTADDATRWDLLAEAQEAALAEATLLPMAASASVLLLGPGEGDIAVRPDGSLDLRVSA